jgi:predicted nucleic acid-binding protein
MPVSGAASGAPSSGGPLFVAELAPIYQTRPRIVVDCSVIAAIIFKEPEAELARQRLTGHALHAPWLLDVELASVALKKARARMSEPLQIALGDFAGLAIDRHEVDAEAVVSLALRYQLSAYDAAYLLVAAELRSPLITFDQKLGVAAQRHLSLLA